MDVLIILAIWLGLGLTGSFLAFECGFRRKGFDIDIADLIFAGVMALLGPLNLVAGFVFAMFNGFGVIDTKKVVFKAKA